MRSKILWAFRAVVACLGLFASAPSLSAQSTENQNSGRWFSQSAFLIYPGEIVTDRFSHELGLKLGYQLDLVDSWFLDAETKVRLQKGILGWSVRPGADLYPVRTLYALAGWGKIPDFLALYSLISVGAFVESDRSTTSGTSYKDAFGFGWKYGLRFTFDNHVLLQFQTVSSYTSFKEPAAVSLEFGVGYAVY